MLNLLLIVLLNNNDTQIDVDGVFFIYKSMVLKSLFSGDKMPKDRLYLVQSMARTMNATTSLNRENVIMAGDLILVSMEKCELQTAMVNGITKGGKKEKIIYKFS